MGVIAVASRQHSVVLDVSGFDADDSAVVMDTLTFAWSWRPEQGWHLWKAEVSGFRRKQDGTVGRSRGHASLLELKLGPPHQWLSTAPEWAIAQARQNWPVPR